MSSEENKFRFSPQMLTKYTAEFLINKVEEIIADFQKKNPSQTELLLRVGIAIIKEIGNLKGW